MVPIVHLHLRMMTPWQQEVPPGKDEMVRLERDDMIGRSPYQAMEVVRSTCFAYRRAEERGVGGASSKTEWTPLGVLDLGRDRDR